MAPQFGGQGGQGGPPGTSSDCNNFFGSDDPNNVCNNNPASDTSNTPGPLTHINAPMFALGLALAAFLLVCLSVCLCTYRRAKARNRATRNLIPREMERGEYVGLGLGLEDRRLVVTGKDEDKAKIDDQAPPAYSPSPSTTPSILRHQPSSLSLRGGPNTLNPRLSLSPSPALAAPISPAFSSYALSPALSQGENEEARLLGGRRPLTPPPPTYAR